MELVDKKTNNTESPVVSIIIVNYNSGELLGNCVNSLFWHLEIEFEVIVYDNFSTDQSILSLSENCRVKIIPGKENLGFARANNLAVRHSTGQFLHFLNPDVEVNDSLNGCYRQILDSNTNAIWVTGITDESGTIQKNRHLVPRIGNIFRYFLKQPDIAYWNLGASVIVHAEAFRKMGGWPEDYFMYAEDLDFFYTAYRIGLPVYYPDAALMHIGQGVTSKIWSAEQRAMIIERSFRKFYRKYNASWEYLIIRPLQLFYILFNEPSTFLLYSKVFVKTLFIR